MSKGEKWLNLCNKYGWIQQGYLVAPPNYRILIKLVNWEGQTIEIQNYSKQSVFEASDDFVVRITRGAAGEFRHYFAWDDVVEIEVSPF